ncbi:hypothetical protein Tco_0450678 [Tanacetum coccineum]
MKGKEVATCEISDLKLSESQSSNARLGQQTVIIQPLSTGFEYPAAYAGTSNFRGVSKLSLFPHVAERTLTSVYKMHDHDLEKLHKDSKFKAEF